MRAYNFFVCGPKFTKFLAAYAGGVVVDHLRFRFSFCRSIPELFALKLKGVVKNSIEMLDVFALQIMLGVHLPKVRH